MVKVHFIERQRDGSSVGRTVAGKAGQSLMKAAVDAGIDGIAADCGGAMTCATCHVYIAEDWLARVPPPEGEELAFLEFTAAEHRAGSRLSCQIRLAPGLDGLQVELPASQY